MAGPERESLPVLRKGTALWMPTPEHRSARSKHLYIVLSEAVNIHGYQPDSVLLVGVSTVRQSAKLDTTCLLTPGSHPRLVSPSYIYYTFAQTMSADDIYREIASGRTEVLEPVAPHVFDRICAGLEASPNTRERILAFYREAERLRLTS